MRKKNFFFAAPFALLLSVAAVASLLLSSCFASVIEPWRNDVSEAMTPRAGHSFGASLLLGDEYFEAPFKIFYGLSDEAELSTRWGIIHAAGNTGISDLKFSVKYNFTKMTSEVPAVFVEGGVSLPTADHTKGLGTGGVGLAV
ncbi:MAG: hypothetical protein QME32_07060, partial [Endomicrobiia bacterium]|nr:hypothetical protein [Endomicrobiia bacterium]